MEKKNSRWSTIGFWLIIAFFYLPILYVIFFSFNRSKSLTNFTGFSLRWYERMFSSRPILEAVGVTFAFLQVDIVPAVSFIGVTTFVLSMVGIKIGNVFGARYKKKAELFGGVVLIGMGLKILLEHLGFLG